MKKAYTVKSSKIVYKNKWVRLREDKFEHRGKEGEINDGPTLAALYQYKLQTSSSPK